MFFQISFGPQDGATAHQQQQQQQQQGQPLILDQQEPDPNNPSPDRFHPFNPRFEVRQHMDNRHERDQSGRPPRSRSRFVGKSGRPPPTCKIFEASRVKSRQIRKSRGNPDFSRLFAQNREKSRCYPTFLDFSRFFPTFPGVFDLKRTGKLGENLDFPRFCPGNSRTVISTRSRFVGKSG